MLISKYQMNQRGVTLPELMIAIGLNAFLLAGLVGIFALNIKHHRETIDEARMNQQMYGAMDLIANEVRRAGYWENATDDIGSGANTNPFMVSGADIAVNASNNCILFTYDSDRDGALAAVNSTTDDERYGFRLQSSAIQARPPGASFDCAAIPGAWENITDPNVVTITNLQFTLNELTVVTGPGTAGLMLRSVDISMTGALTNDSTVTKTLTQHVRVRNDKFVP